MKSNVNLQVAVEIERCDKYERSVEVESGAFGN